MRASFEALRQRISPSVKAISQQGNLPAKAISAIIVATTIGFALHQGAQRDPEMSEVAAQAAAGKRRSERLCVEEGAVSRPR